MDIQPAPMSPFTPDPQPQDLTVLIVDDEPMLRSVIQEFLLMLGFDRFQTAGDGVEALEILRREPIDCMISDIRMPEMELEEVLQVVNEEFPELVVIATSGYSDFSSASNIIYAGADDFLGKPLNLDHLELAINWIAERQRVLNQVRRLVPPGSLLTGQADYQSFLEAMRPMLTQPGSSFALPMQHTLRIGQLLAGLQTDLTPAMQGEVLRACCLHELGLSCQVHMLCQQARRLEEQEYELILHAMRINGKRVARAIGRPDYETIVARHLTWVELSKEVYLASEPAERGAAWLGLVNSIDGLRQNRPDRPGRSLDGLRGWLDRRRIVRNLPPLDAVLDQWPLIEQFYDDPGQDAAS